MAAPGVDAAASACEKGCPEGCPAGTHCVSTSAASSFTGFCAVSCTTYDDCPQPDQQCVQLTGESPGRWCASWAVPSRCPNAPAAFSCDAPPAACVDARVLSLPLSWKDNQVCATEFLSCPNRCVSGASDGGAASAHCE
jgi:hypothetical protein